MKNPKENFVVDVDALSARDRAILTDIIHTFTLSGEPVSSRAVSKHAEHHLSAATIRNVMADLEDLGLLCQPHTSAGRVPTEAAYRLYVGGLMTNRAIPIEERRYIDENLSEAAGSPEQVMAKAGELLSELSSQVGMVVSPAVAETVLKSLDFVSLGGGRVLCVLVSTTGFVDHLVIESGEEWSREDLVRASNYLTENFSGISLREIRDRLVKRMAAERRTVDDWLQQALNLANRAISDSVSRDVVVKGTVGLLEQPELSSLESVRRMLDTFADKAKLVEILNRCMATEGVRVFLGADSDVTSELDFGVVAATYDVDAETHGTLGIMGPARMEYPRIVPLVRYLSQNLGKALRQE